MLPLLNGLLTGYRLYYPGNSKECSVLAVKTLVKVYIISGSVFIILFGLSPTIYSVILSFFFIYAFSSEIISSSHIKLEIRFLKAFDDFLGDVRHHYFKLGSVRDALIASETDADPIIKGHAGKMIRIMSSPEPEMLVNEYVNSGYHKYLKFFLTLSRLVEENGDQEDEKGSVFLNSCMRIRYDVREDLRFISERKHRFSGLMLTVSLPAAAIPFIAMWGTSTIPSLTYFYYGYAGTVTKLILIIVSFICFKAFFRLKYGEYLEKRKSSYATRFQKLRIIQRLSSIRMRLAGKKAYLYDMRIKRLGEKYTVKTFYIKKTLFFIFFYFIALITLFIGHYESRKLYKYDISDIENVTSVTDQKQLEALKRLIPEYTAFFCERGYAVSEEELKAMLLEDKDLKNESVAQKAAEEIIKRYDLFRDEIFGFRDIVFCLIFAFLASIYPDMSLSFRKTLIDSRLQDEVMQFQSIIHILKKIPGMSVVSLLEEMERFSSIFRPALKKCINDFSISDSGALNRLYEEEKYPGFRRIVDCFMMAEELGPEDAFEEISSEIENYSENRKLERKMLLDNEGMLGAVISVLPGGLILFGYLLCPFMIRSIQIFNEYQAGISMMGR